MSDRSTDAKGVYQYFIQQIQAIVLVKQLR